jgi:hypothetical protein
VLAFLGGQALYQRLPRRPVVDVWPAVPAYSPAGSRPLATRRRVALALAGPESRELSLSPAFGAGLAFCATIVILFGFIWPEDSEGNIAEVAQLVPIFVHPLVGMVIIAAHRARTRSRRDGTEELFEACPATQDTRNVAHLATAWLPAVICTAFSFLMVGLVTAQVARAWGPVEGAQVAALLSTGVLAVGGVALAVGLARWAPWTIVPIVAVVVIGFLSIRLATAGGSDQREPLRLLSTFLGDLEIDYRLVAPHYLARLGWLVSLVVLVTALGLLKDRRNPGVVAIGTVAAVAATGFALATARPIDADEARRIAAMLNDPVAHQECVGAGDLEVCTWRGDRDLAALIADEVRPVVAAVPAGTLDRYSIGAEATVDRYELDPEVFALVDGDIDPGVLPARMGGHGDTLQAARLWVALAATGVIEDWRPGSTLSIPDEARGVVALWLAVQGADRSVVRSLTTFVPNPEHGVDGWRPWPDPCYAGDAPVRWAVADIGATRLLLDLPPSDVQDLLDGRWAWVTDPSTTTGELLAALGLEPTAPAAELTRTASC